MTGTFLPDAVCQTNYYTGYAVEKQRAVQRESQFPGALNPQRAYHLRRDAAMQRKKRQGPVMNLWKFFPDCVIIIKLYEKVRAAVKRGSASPERMCEEEERSI
jgi:hypothetical protein